MNCIKCGVEIEENRVFCENCLAEMRRFPVKPGTPVLLPNRPSADVPKKAVLRKKALTPEEQIRNLRKAIQWLSVLLAVSLIAFIFSVSLLWEYTDAKNVANIIGQNYNTVSDLD